MRVVTWCAWLAVLAALAPLGAQAEPEPPEREAPAAELERLLHKAIVARLPKVYEDDSAWGQTVPLPERVRLPRLRRTVVRVGDRLEVPHGPWRKLRLWVEEPDRDLRVRV